MTGFFSNAPVTYEEAETFAIDDGSILNIILREKNIRHQDKRLQYIAVHKAALFQILLVLVLF